MNWNATIHHGMPLDALKFNPKPKGYLAFLGRISPEKRPDRAIEIARKAGKKIKIAAKIDAADVAYSETIAHLFKEPHVEYIGEISDHQKSEFLGNADALLFPIDWPEPFGLVMMEAMATGTPVVAYPNGSVPEVIQDQKNGFLVNSVEEAVIAVNQLPSLPRARCRQYFEQRFSSERMARDYLQVYQKHIHSYLLSEMKMPYPHHRAAESVRNVCTETLQ